MEFKSFWLDWIILWCLTRNKYILSRQSVPLFFWSFVDHCLIWHSYKYAYYLLSIQKVEKRSNDTLGCRTNTIYTKKNVHYVWLVKYKIIHVFFAPPGLKKMFLKVPTLCSLLQFNKAISIFFWHNCISKLKKKSCHTTCPHETVVRVNHTTKMSKICLSKATNLQELVTKWDFHHKLIRLYKRLLIKKSAMDITNIKSL